MTPLFAFLPNFGGWEIMLIAFIALLFFGNRLPSVMRSLGKSVTEFKHGLNSVEDEIEQAGKEKKAVPTATATATTTTSEQA